MQQQTIVLRWLLKKLEALQEEPTLLVRDHFHATTEDENSIHTFATQHQYTVILAATNLAFRDLYEKAIDDPEVKRLLVIDRTPQSRRNATIQSGKAPALFYPDLLARIPERARIVIDIRTILVEHTNDPEWPDEVNNPIYTQLILQHLPHILVAHEKLRVAHMIRFSDHDFRTIVAYAALDIADKAFQRLDTADYWRVGLLGQHSLKKLDALIPQITQPIKDLLAKAPAPFCWFGQQEPETALHAFYLSVLLAQHFPESVWRLLLIYADASLSGLDTIVQSTLDEAMPQLVALAPEQVKEDLQDIEGQLNREALQRLFFSQMDISNPETAATLLEKERYSTLFRNQALLLALDNLLSTKPRDAAHQRIKHILDAPPPTSFVEQRVSPVWSILKEAYQLATSIQVARKALERGIKQLNIALRNTSEQPTFTMFRDLWNANNINRIEYMLSALKRLVYNANLLDRPVDEMPEEYATIIARLKERIEQIEKEAFQQLHTLNTHFQNLVQNAYPDWLTLGRDIYFSSQFISRCLKSHWDPQKEKAIVFVFDGMRYDIWDELLRPTLLEKMEIIEEFPASSILPSETHISRWAIAAGSEPETFGLTPHRAENALLKEALERELRYPVSVDVIAPEGTGTGETVRYQAGNLNYYIFDFCDKELHSLRWKTFPDGRKEPNPPLAFVYQQYVKNFIDTEIAAIVRGIEPDTKVFIVADHGFGLVGQDFLSVDSQNLNDPEDCSYLNCVMKVSFDQAYLSAKTRTNCLHFTSRELHYPQREDGVKYGQEIHKRNESMLFPKMGYSFSRQGSSFRPKVYGHGGISLQEMLIPMVVLKVKKKEEGLLFLTDITGSQEIIEGEEGTFQLLMRTQGRRRGTQQDMRVEIEARYSNGEREPEELPQRTFYVSQEEIEVSYRFRPNIDAATVQERHQGSMQRELSIIARYTDKGRTFRKIQKYTFTVRLNSERVIRRVPTTLGNILGLTPRSMW